MTTAAVILAAGKGTRMRSDLPKVLHRLMGAPLLEYVLEKVEALGCDPRVVVVGHGRDLVQAEFRDRGVVWAVQEEQRGTGHAASVGLLALGERAGEVLILNGDLPLLEIETLRGMLERHREQSADVTVLPSEMANPTGY